MEKKANVQVLRGQVSSHFSFRRCAEIENFSNIQKFQEIQTGENLVAGARIFVTDESFLRKSSVPLRDAFREITRRSASRRERKYKETMFEGNTNCRE